MDTWFLTAIIIVASLQVLLTMWSLYRTSKDHDETGEFLEAINSNILTTNCRLEDIAMVKDTDEEFRKWQKDVFMYVIQSKALSHTPTHAIPMMREARAWEAEVSKQAGNPNVTQEEEEPTSPPKVGMLMSING